MLTRSPITYSGATVTSAPYGRSFRTGRLHQSVAGGHVADADDEEENRECNENDVEHVILLSSEEAAASTASSARLANDCVLIRFSVGRLVLRRRSRVRKEFISAPERHKEFVKERHRD